MHPARAPGHPKETALNCLFLLSARGNRVFQPANFIVPVFKTQRILLKSSQVKNKKILQQAIVMVSTLVLLCLSVSAQRYAGYYNQAEKLFNGGSYYEAAQVYEKYLATEKNSRPRSQPFAVEKKVKGKANLDPHEEAVYHVAESYRMIHNYPKAEKYYKEATGFSPKAYPASVYWYAVTLRANRKYPEASRQLSLFLEKHTRLDDC